MVLRMIAIFILIPKFDFIAVVFADAAAWVGALAVNMMAYFVIFRRNIRKKSSPYNR